jgi:hypothetical protein
MRKRHFEKAIAIVNEAQRLDAKAAALRKKEPSSRTMLPPTDEILERYEHLRQAWRDEFLLQHRIALRESRIKVARGDILGCLRVSAPGTGDLCSLTR